LRVILGGEMSSKSYWSIVALACFLASHAYAQTKLPGSVFVQPGDLYSADASTDQRIKLFPSLMRPGSVPSAWSRASKDADTDSTVFSPVNIPLAARKSASTVNNAASAKTLFYPADMVSSGGPVVTSARNHVGFVNCQESCWGGGIQTYIINLSTSTDIKIVNQYVGVTSSNRYPLGTVFSVSFGPNPPHTIHDSDARAIVHAMIAANQSAAGLSNIYHVFLPPGQDLCVDNSNTVCYSPDNPNTFYFCGYHSSVTFQDFGTALYSVEPYLGVPGCQASGQDLTSAQANTLGHEIFETITDPIPVTGWTSAFPPLGNSYGSEEIADDCAWVLFTRTVGKGTYTTQLEYSNHYHACSNH
jgi:hypothetical protein